MLENVIPIGSAYRSEGLRLVSQLPPAGSISREGKETVKVVVDLEGMGNRLDYITDVHNYILQRETVIPQIRHSEKTSELILNHKFTDVFLEDLAEQFNLVLR